MRLVIMIFYLILIVLGVSFSFLNATPLTVNLYFKSYTLPLSFLLIGVFTVGLIWGLFFFFMKYVRLKLAYRKLKDQLLLTEKEVKNLRSIPIQDQH